MHESQYRLDFDSAWKLSEQLPRRREYLKVDLYHQDHFQTSLVLNLSHQKRTHSLLYLENAKEITLPLSLEFMQDLSFILGNIALYDAEFSRYLVSARNTFRLSTSNSELLSFFEGSLEAKRARYLSSLFSMDPPSVLTFLSKQCDCDPRYYGAILHAYGGPQDEFHSELLSHMLEENKVRKKETHISSLIEQQLTSLESLIEQNGVANPSRLREEIQTLLKEKFAIKRRKRFNIKAFEEHYRQFRENGFNPGFFLKGHFTLVDKLNQPIKGDEDQTIYSFDWIESVPYFELRKKRLQGLDLFLEINFSFENATSLPFGNNLRVTSFPQYPLNNSEEETNYDVYELEEFFLEESDWETLLLEHSLSLNSL